MVSVDPNKKYLSLDGVRISYRPKDDTIHITSTDPDVAAGGFHLNLSRGTQTEETLRDLLAEHGMIGAGLDRSAFGSLPVETAAKHVSTSAPAPGPRKRALILSVMGGKGGVGRSTTALMLGAKFAQLGTDGNRLKVLVVDMSVEHTQLAYLTGVTKPSILNYATAPDRPARGAVARDAKLDVDLLLAPLRLHEEATLLTPELHRRALLELIGEYDVVILDNTTAYLDAYNTLAWEFADAVLYVTDQSVSSLYTMSATLLALKERRGDLSKVGVIVNQSMRDTGVGVEMLKRAAQGAVLLGAIPHNSELVQKATNHGLLHETVQGSNEISSALQSLAKKILPRDVTF